MIPTIIQFYNHKVILIKENRKQEFKSILEARKAAREKWDGEIIQHLFPGRREK